MIRSLPHHDLASISLFKIATDPSFLDHVIVVHNKICVAQGGHASMGDLKQDLVPELEILLYMCRYIRLGIPTRNPGPHNTMPLGHTPDAPSRLANDVPGLSPLTPFLRDDGWTCLYEHLVALRINAAHLGYETQGLPKGVYETLWDMLQVSKGRVA